MMILWEAKRCISRQCAADGERGVTVSITDQDEKRKDGAKQIPMAHGEFVKLSPEEAASLHALLDEGIPALLTNTRGTIHDFETVLSSPIVRKCVDDRISFLSSIFQIN